MPFLQLLFMKEMPSHVVSVMSCFWDLTTLHAAAAQTPPTH